MRKHRATIRRAIAFAVLVLVGFPLLIWAAERRSNPDIASLPSAELWLVRTAIEDGSPYGLSTFWAYVIYALVTVAGIGVLGILVGAVSGRLTAAVASRTSGLGVSAARNHLLVSGWNPRGAEVLADMARTGTGTGGRKVVVIAGCAEPPPGLAGAEFIRGDPTDPDDLCRAGAHRAHTALFLADASDGSTDPADRDARALLSCLALESINPDCHTVAEVVRLQDRDLFALARADEIIVGTELTGALLAGSARLPGLPTLVSGLLTHRGSDGFTCIDLPEGLAGQPFLAVVEAVKARLDVLVVGVRCGPDLVVNPDAGRPVAADEALLVLGPAQVAR